MATGDVTLDIAFEAESTPVATQALANLADRYSPAHHQREPSAPILVCLIATAHVTSDRNFATRWLRAKPA
jgi:hypothetical protein